MHSIVSKLSFKILQAILQKTVVINLIFLGLNEFTSVRILATICSILQKFLKSENIKDLYNSTYTYFRTDHKYIKFELAYTNVKHILNISLISNYVNKYKLDSDITLKQFSITFPATVNVYVCIITHKDRK
jgi:hypothetical protein